MAKMTERMQNLFNQQKVVVLATADPDGVPNAVPVGAKEIIDDETILISDQYFNKTLANLKANPVAAVTVWEGHEGYQFKGRITIETEGERYERAAQWVAEKGKKAGRELRSKGIVLLHIEAIYGVSPGPNAGAKLT
jgi:uncharacterized protein